MMVSNIWSLNQRAMRLLVIYLSIVENKGRDEVFSSTRETVIVDPSRFRGSDNDANLNNTIPSTEASYFLDSVFERSKIYSQLRGFARPVSITS